MSRRNLGKDPLDLDRKFDVVLMVALIEQIIDHLKPGGKIVITTPTMFGNDIVHRIGAKFGLFSKSAVDDYVVTIN